MELSRDAFNATAFGYRSNEFTLWVCTQRAASCLHFDRFYVIRTRYTFRDIDERVEHGGTWLELLANTLERGDNHVVIWKQKIDFGTIRELQFGF